MTSVATISMIFLRINSP